jgi:hypothetical protein
MTNADFAKPQRFLALFGTIAAAIFVGGSGLLVVHSLLIPVEPRQLMEASPDSAGGDRTIADAIDKLTRVLEASDVSAPSQSSAEPSQRVLATESGNSATTTEFAAAIRDLRDLLQSTTFASTAVRAPMLTLPREELRGNLPVLPSDVKDQGRAYTRQHLFWSEQQVLDHYGLPEEIGVPSVHYQIWYYQPEGQRRFSIRLAQGRVIGVDL